MLKMVPKLHIPMPSRRDMKIPLHLIPRQAPKNATTAPPAPRSPAKLPLRAPDLIQDMSGMGIPFEFLLLRHGEVIQEMHPLGVHPLIPIGRIFPQLLAGQDAIAAGVLHVDVEVGTAHGYHDVEVDLELMRHPLLDGEEVRFMSAIPTSELGHGQNGGCDEQEERGVAPRRAAAGVGRFGFGCRRGHTGEVSAEEKRTEGGEREDASSPREDGEVRKGEEKEEEGEREVRHTESVERSQALGEALLLAKRGLVQAMIVEAIHRRSNALNQPCKNE